MYWSEPRCAPVWTNTCVPQEPVMSYYVWSHRSRTRSLFGTPMCVWSRVVAYLCTEKANGKGLLWWLQVTGWNFFRFSLFFPPPGSGSSNALMEAERSGGVAGGTNQSPAGSGAGRDPNGPKAVLGPAPNAAAAAGAMTGSSQLRDPQDGDAGLSLPGILHFIQFEWGRFQAEKYRWEAERDELRVNLLSLMALVLVSSRRIHGGRARWKIRLTIRHDLSTACFCCLINSVLCYIKCGIR